MKTKRVRALALFLLLTMLALTSCGGFFSEPARQIARVEPVELEDGSWKILIHYTDDTYESEEFIIPPGKQGAIGVDGNGIDEIIFTHDDENYRTEVRIKYTDTKMEDFVSYIPDGLSIIEVVEGFDEDVGKTYIDLIYNNPDVAPQRFFLPQGDPGIGIDQFEVTPTEDGGFDVFITLTDERSHRFIIPPGKTGNGIAAIMSEDDKENDQYILTIYYTYEEMEPTTLYFDRPADPNQWFAGLDPYTDERTAASSDGDYYFDTNDKKILFKEFGSWVEIVDFGAMTEKIIVTFDLNDTTGTAQMPTGTPSNGKYQLTEGESFFAAGRTLPIPMRPGYRFVGWYTAKDAPYTAVGAFNDITPVMSDTTLYAIWEPRFTVSFDLGVAEDDPAQAVMPENAEKNNVDGIYVYEVNQNTYFVANNGAIPVPTREGYTFMGWYTKDAVDATMSPLTDLTPICSDLYLYAIWQAN